MSTVDLKKWFEAVITPDFASDEARARCGSLSPSDFNFTPVRRLEEATRVMRTTSQNFNMVDLDYVALDKPQKSCCARWFSPMEPGSVRTCSVALAATALGAGALALPAAFAKIGVGLGLLTLTAAALVSALSLQILMMAARYTGTTSYAAVLELSMGSPLISNLLDAVVVMNGIGAVTCILIFEGDFLPSVFALPPGGLPGFELPRLYAVLGAAAAVWPLTLPAEIAALRYVSAFVPVALLVTIAIVLWDAPEFAQEVQASGEKLVWWNFDFKAWLQAAAIMVNAFANHTNAVPSANLLDKPSTARIVKATFNGNAVVWFILASLGIGGYISFGLNTKGDFLLNYPQDRPEIWTCRLMLALTVFFVLPVALLPTARSGAQLVLRTTRRGHREVGRRLHAASATVLLVACTCVAASVNDVAVVIGFLGGLLASALMFWFPAMVLRKLLWPALPRSYRKPAFVSLLFFGISGWLSVAAGYV